jgi:hypothetical protein
MDDVDRALVLLMGAGLALAVLLLAHAVKDLQEDVDLLRVTAAVPAIERHTDEHS